MSSLIISNPRSACVPLAAGDITEDDVIRDAQLLPVLRIGCDDWFMDMLFFSSRIIVVRSDTSFLSSMISWGSRVLLVLSLA